MPANPTRLDPLSQRRRLRVDRLTTAVIGTGGVAVMLTISAIFIYLLFVALPLFQGADIDDPVTLHAHTPSQHRAALLDVEESGEIGIRIDDFGAIEFFAIEDGATLRSQPLLAEPEVVLRVHRISPEPQRYALELAHARFVFVDVRFPVSFASGVRQRLVEVDYPFGPEALDAAAVALEAPRSTELDSVLDSVLDSALDSAMQIRASAVHVEDSRLTVALITDGAELVLSRYRDAEPGLPLLPPATRSRIAIPPGAGRIVLAGAQWLFVLYPDGRLIGYDIRFADAPQQLLTARLPATSIDTVAPLVGGYSLLIAERGGIGQHFPVRGEDGGWQLQRVRGFATGDAVALILPEARRRGFAALGEDGALGVFHTTAERNLIERSVLTEAPRAAALSARSDLLLVETSSGVLQRLHIDNPHPEISLRALFAPLWYEGYAEPTLSWQSSSASSDFEPKFSLAPLALGTLKAALYGMLFAVPLALFAAIYTAYFMAPRVRQWIKPSIEIMAALPTVILGFLAGLWLAPIIEARLASVLLLLLALPLACMVAGFGSRLLPASLRHRLPDGWQALALMPLLALCTLASFELGPELDALLFSGDLRSWLRSQFGLDYDQRNALIVGIAMGVAVTPVIFAIAEDAIHSVPATLSHGALALGATRWQTLLRIVLPAASPAVFSALMIGFGRAVGETMIVLMASGNTPLLDMNPFSGMRTFAANIAVELPESEVSSTHYRILFLAALLLFVFTFAVNTVGEIVRQRLRDRFGAL